MLFKQSLLIVAAFLMAVAHSLPGGNNNITWYGDQTPAERSFDSTTVDLSRRQCGSGNLTCSDKYVYTAYQSDCAGLQSVLSGQPYNGTVRRTSNSVCYLAGGQASRRCCISATRRVPNVVDEDWLNFVMILNNQCGGPPGQVAGLISYTTFKSECNTVCLSNHYNKCMWLFLGEWK
jgi:hypothetical protein